MKINEVTLHNFRQFEEETITFPDSNFITILGANGSGKTTILDGIAMCLSHIVGKLTSPKDDYNISYSINTKDIQNGQTNSKFSSVIDSGEKIIEIEVSKEINQKSNSFDFEPSNPFKELRKSLLNESIESNLPLIVFYRANRTFSIKNDTNPGSYFTKPLNGYRFALNQNTSAFTPSENWFLKEESIENEKKVELQSFDFKSTSLVPVRKAIENFLSAMGSDFYSNFRGKRSDDSNFHYGDSVIGELLIDKGDETIKLNQLSSGERAVISLVLDISIRLTMLNSNSENSLEQTGIVLIDEIEMHLHPKWQRNLIAALKLVFPNIQFIVSTHSPQVLSRVSAEDIIILSDKTHYSASSNPLGRDSNGILEEIFQTESRPQEVENTINNIYTSLNNSEIEEVNSLIEKLTSMIGSSDPVLKRINSIKERLNILKS